MGKAPDKERAKRDSTEFYREHQAEMDSGCDVSWKSCFDSSNEISAIQHAYNELIDYGQDVFDSECQQSPSDRIHIGKRLLERERFRALLGGRAGRNGAQRQESQYERNARSRYDHHGTGCPGICRSPAGVFNYRCEVRLRRLKR